MITRPSLESICSQLYGDDESSNELLQSGMSDGNLDEALVAAILKENDDAYRRTVAMVQRKVRADGKATRFYPSRAEQGDIVTIQRLPDGEQLNSPVVVVLDMLEDSKRKTWSVWHASPYAGYATAYDFLLDDRQDMNPAVGMVLAWARSVISLEFVGDHLARLSANDIAAVRALSDEFLLQPAIQATEEERQAMAMQRTTLGGQPVRTGPPLLESRDERAGFAQLYTSFAADLTGCFEVATSGASEPAPVVRAKQTLRRWISGYAQAAPSFAVRGAARHAESVRSGSTSFAFMDVRPNQGANAAGLSGSKGGATKESAAPPEGLSWECDGTEYSLRETPDRQMQVLSNPPGALQQAERLRWFDQEYVLGPPEQSGSRLVIGLTPLLCDLLLQRAETEDESSVESIPWLDR